jgi:hypothetical protein
MSDRHGPDQLELLPLAPTEPDPRGPIDGPSVHLDRHCACGTTVTVVVEGKSPHAAVLRRPDCDRFRQRPPCEVDQFLVELVDRFGRRTEPVKSTKPSPKGD